MKWNDLYHRLAVYFDVIKNPIPPFQWDGDDFISRKIIAVSLEENNLESNHTWNECILCTIKFKNREEESKRNTEQSIAARFPLIEHRMNRQRQMCVICAWNFTSHKYWVYNAKYECVTVYFMTHFILTSHSLAHKCVYIKIELCLGDRVHLMILGLVSKWFAVIYTFSLTLASYKTHHPGYVHYQKSPKIK